MEINMLLAYKVPIPNSLQLGALQHGIVKAFNDDYIVVRNVNSNHFEIIKRSYVWYCAGVIGFD